MSWSLVASRWSLGLAASTLIACGGGSNISETSEPTVAFTVPPAIATEFALGGPFDTTDQAEDMVGFRLLRPDPSLLELEQNGESGIVDVFPEVGLPRARQSFRLVGKEDWLDLTQEPASYPTSPDFGTTTNLQIGSFDGQLTEFNDQVSFEFLTGETLDGVAIRATVVSLGGHSVSDVRDFVESLAFEQP